MPAFDFEIEYELGKPEPSASWYVRNEIDRWQRDPIESDIPHAEESNGSPLEQVKHAIAESQQILNLKDDWDGDGSQGYKLETLRRATDFLIDLTECLENLGFSAPEVPQIQPADEGSIDIFWRNDERDFLINFPPNMEVEPMSFGKNKCGDIIEGRPYANYSKTQLIEWLSKGK